MFCGKAEVTLGELQASTAGKNNRFQNLVWAPNKEKLSNDTKSRTTVLLLRVIKFKIGIWFSKGASATLANQRKYIVEAEL